ncbi:MAG: amidohydrolase [Bacteroidales bacterium]|jgi:predicted TIM-barrel fold metal-dependent hydrolase|nr:amidohydrolase [Bacteroidales bacterium]
MKKITEKIFYDVHCHILDLTQPNFFVYVNEFKDKLGNEAVKFLLSPDYIIDSNNKHAIEKLANLLNVMSHSQSEIIDLVENDLNGFFLKSAKEKPFIKEGEFRIREMNFDKYCMTPLVMDFNVAYQNYENLYYNIKQNKDVEYFAESFYSSVNEFYKKNPDSKLELYPFLGINTPSYELKQIEKFLHRYLRRYEPVKRSTSMASRSALFAGIKLYPPLGFDPWPSDKKEREKVELIYNFAVEKNIPVTTHCDDGGYRIIAPEEAWKYTSPDRYSEILKKYPGLKINFAHLGQQYYRSYGIFKQNDWRIKIFKLMLEYPNVYSDFSFSIIAKNYFKTIMEEIKEFEKDEQKIIMDRIMFGSDFNINLNKVNSYTEYLRIFEDSILPDDLIMKFCNKNPEKFLFS